MSAVSKLATFAAGCFWGVEEAFLSSGKCLTTKVGYSGGHTTNPSYKEVCTGQTGHAESVQVSYEGDKYGDLLKIFFSCHNPTQSNRQGYDVGTQYRSVIFYHDAEQEAMAREAIAKHPGAVTQLVPAAPFYPAEEYHQQYFRKNGGGKCH